MTDDCKHWSGDEINGFWLCATCYAKLPERPRKYLMTQESGDRAPRQDMVLAPVATAQGYTLGQFVDAMALRLIARTLGAFKKNDAIDYAVDILKTFGEHFGDHDLDWTAAGAHDLVDEDLSYWEVYEPLSN